MKYTWRGRTRNGVVQSRLDYFFVSTHMIYDLVNVTINPSISSDHSIINIELNIACDQKRGSVFWKFNAILLKDNEYVSLIKNLIKNCKAQYNNYENKALLWDIIKCQIRSETISYAASQSKLNKQVAKKLMKELNNLENKINNGKDVHKEFLVGLLDSVLTKNNFQFNVTNFLQEEEVQPWAKKLHPALLSHTSKKRMYTHTGCNPSFILDTLMTSSLYGNMAKMN